MAIEAIISLVFGAGLSFVGGWTLLLKRHDKTTFDAMRQRVQSVEERVTRLEERKVDTVQVQQMVTTELRAYQESQQQMRQDVQELIKLVTELRIELAARLGHLEREVSGE